MGSSFWGGVGTLIGNIVAPGIGGAIAGAVSDGAEGAIAGALGGLDPVGVAGVASAVYNGVGGIDGEANGLFSDSDTDGSDITAAATATETAGSDTDTETSDEVAGERVGGGDSGYSGIFSSETKKRRVGSTLAGEGSSTFKTTDKLGA